MDLDKFLFNNKYCVASNVHWIVIFPKYCITVSDNELTLNNYKNGSLNNDKKTSIVCMIKFAKYIWYVTSINDFFDFASFLCVANKTQSKIAWNQQSWPDEEVSVFLNKRSLNYEYHRFPIIFWYLQHKIFSKSEKFR